MNRTTVLGVLDNSLSALFRISGQNVDDEINARSILSSI